MKFLPILVTFFTLPYLSMGQDSLFFQYNGSNLHSIALLKEKRSGIGVITPYLPVITIFAAFVGLLGISYQIKARRKDDLSKTQLDRLNKQISEFYGPLYSLYETGHQNFYAYLELYGEEFDLDNPNYLLWDTSIFQPTNLRMEEIMMNKADLVVGNEIPDFIFEFSEWLTAHKAYMNASSQPKFDNESWKPITESYEHPQDRMRFYIKAAFEVLKKVQGEMLSGKRRLINESEVLTDILNTQCSIVENPETNAWEKSVWAKVRHREEVEITIIASEKALIAASFVPSSWKC